MNIFIDESGIHKTIGHSTIVFVYLEIKNLDEIEKQILKINKKLKIKYFHWANHGWKIKKKFIKYILKLDFLFKLAVLKNPINFKVEFEKVLKHLIVEKRINKILIDGKSPRWQERKLKFILREKGISLKKLRTLNDKSSPGLRLADCLAGLTRYYFDNPSGEAKKYYNKLKEKIILSLMFEK